VRSGAAHAVDTILVGEEAGATAGLYELIDPEHINAPIPVVDCAPCRAYARSGTTDG